MRIWNETKNRLLALFLSLLFLCSCAAKPDRTSAEEVERLKEQYLYNDDAFYRAVIADGWFEKDVYPDFETWVRKVYSRMPAAVVVMKITSDWYLEGYYVPLFEDSDPEVAEEIRQQQEEEWWNTDVHEVFDAEIESVLWQSPYEDAWHGKQLVAGDRITLQFGSSLGEYVLDETYIIGDRYVCFLVDDRDNKGFSDDVEAFITDTSWTFHLSDDDVLISAISAPGPDSCTGMYLHAFEKLICEALDGQMEE